MKKTVLYCAILAALSLAAACEDSAPSTPDFCPDNPDKTLPGICGCGVPDTDSNGDTVPDCLAQKLDQCPDDPDKTLPGICGCGVPDTDSNGDTVPDCLDKNIDLCPDDPDKTLPGICGCGVPDADSDNDTIPDCLDKCPNDPSKISSGICGCGIADSPENAADTDGDTIPNCLDKCPLNPFKSNADDTACDDPDADVDGVEDALDECPLNPHYAKKPENGDCNTVTIDGVDYFQIYTANDLLALREKLPADAPQHGDICFNMYEIRCSGDNQALICMYDRAGVYRYVATPCASCTPASDKNQSDTCKCIDNGKKENGSCCTDETPIDDNTSEILESVCSEGGAPISCTNGRLIMETACNNTAVCKETKKERKSDHTEIIISATCDTAQDPCPDAPVSNGIPGNCCDPDTYEKTCNDNVLNECVLGTVTETPCAGECIQSDGPKKAAWCTQPVKPPKFHVQLMTDIDLSQIIPTTGNLTHLCHGAWTPIDLAFTEFDGQNHTISFSQGPQTCTLHQPLFGNISHSTVKNLRLAYNMALVDEDDKDSMLPAAFANNVQYSAIDNIRYSGNTTIGKGINSDSSLIGMGFFGGIINYASYSAFSNLDISENIHFSNKIFQTLNAVFGMLYACDVRDIKLAIPSMDARFTSFFAGPSNYSRILNLDISLGKITILHTDGIFNNINASIVKHIRINLERLTSTYDTPDIMTASSMLARNVQETTYMEDLAFTASNNIQLKAPLLGFEYFYGNLKQADFTLENVRANEFRLFNILYGNINDVTVNIHDISTETLAGLAFSTQGDYQNIDISIDNAECSLFTGMAESVSGKIEDADIHIKNLSVHSTTNPQTSNGFAGKIENAIIQSANLQIDNIQTESPLNGFANLVTNSNLKSLNVRTGDIIARKASDPNAAIDVSGFIRAIYKNSVISNAQVNIGTIQSPGSAYGAFYVTNDTNIQDSSFKIKAIYASTSFGVFKYISNATLRNNTFDIEYVMSEKLEAYGFANDVTSSSIHNSQIRIDKIHSGTSNAYGLAIRVNNVELLNTSIYLPYIIGLDESMPITSATDLTMTNTAVYARAYAQKRPFSWVYYLATPGRFKNTVLSTGAFRYGYLDIDTLPKDVYDADTTKDMQIAVRSDDPTLDVNSTYWLKRADSDTDYALPNITNFSPDSAADIVKFLGDGWYMLSVDEETGTITIPFFTPKKS